MLQCVRRLEDLCTRYDFAYYREWATVLQGWFSGGIDGADQIRGAVGRLRKQGALVRHPYYLSLLAETLINVGRTDAAGAVLDAAKAAAAAHEDRWWVPELWRLDARRHPGPRGEGRLRRATALADEQHSPNLRLRAAADLDRRERDPNATRTHDRLSSAKQAPDVAKGTRMTLPRTISYDPLREAMRGVVIEPQSADYDRPRRLQRNDRPPPGGDRTLHRRR